MDTIKDKALEYLGYQLSVMPLTEDKTPILQAWKTLQTGRIKETQVEELFSKAQGIAIICGAISGNLEVIDVGCKHDINGSLWEDFKALIEDNIPGLFNRLVIAKTQNKGYHIYYSCSRPGRSVEIAKRPSTTEEREQTYQNALAKSGAADNYLSMKSFVLYPKTPTKPVAAEVQAIKAYEDDKGRVLIATIGEGGYIAAPPTPGYSYIQGGPGKIVAITSEERGSLFSIARSFNDLPEDKSETKPKGTTDSSTELSPLEDYDQRGEVLELFENNGWRVVNQRGERIYLIRPGQADTKTSGNFHTGLRVLRVFNSSKEFNPDKEYSPSQIYSQLECNGDDRLTYRRLLELGYGEPLKGHKTSPTQLKTEQIKVEAVNSVNKVTSVISNPGERLKIEKVQTAMGNEVIITSPGTEATQEVLKALELIEETGKRTYVVEAGTEKRGQFYRLQAIIDKYRALLPDSGVLTERQLDNFLTEVVEIGSRIPEPIGRDLYKKTVLATTFKGLDIKEESYQIAIDRLSSTRDREAQAQELKELLSEANRLQAQGETAKALELIINRKAKEAKLKDKDTEFNGLLVPVKEEEIKKRQHEKIPSLFSGYTIGEEELMLPPGAISIFAAPTSHGKTTLLINLALNVAKRYPDKQVYLFSYEEDSDTILLKTLNTYLGEDISQNNKKDIKSYFTADKGEVDKALELLSSKLEEIKLRAKDTEFNSLLLPIKQVGTMQDTAKTVFTLAKNKFFNELIAPGRLNIHYVNYNSETLIDAIRYLYKNANLGAVFIDDIQLINLPQRKYKTYSSQEEMKAVCQSFKDLAVETGLPIILGAQFNREVTNQIRLHPTQIGASVDIERVANLIVGFWNNDFTPMGTEAELSDIAKRRYGGKDTIYVKVLKGRDIKPGLDEILQYNGNTGVIRN